MKKPPAAKKPAWTPPPPPPPQAWRLPADRSADSVRSLNVSGRGLFDSLRPGDAVLLTDRSGCWAWGVRRVCVAHMEGRDTFLAFDRALDFGQSVRLSATPPAVSASAALRCDWEEMENALAKAKAPAFDALVAPDGSDPKDRPFVRDLLQRAVQAELLGPAGGEEEELVEAPRIRYLVGRLGPLNDEAGEEGEAASPPADNGAGEAEEAADTLPAALEREAASQRTPSDDRKVSSPSEEEDEEDVAEAVDLSTTASFTPSSMGMTFCLDAALPPKIVVAAGWGRYSRTASLSEMGENGKPLLRWRRVQQGGSRTMPLAEGEIPPFAPDPSQPEVIVQGRVSKPIPGANARLVTLFLVNRQVAPERRKDEAWIFQPRLEVSSPTGAAIFRKRPIPDANKDDAELRALDMLYRHEVEFAVGHNVSVHADADAARPDTARSIRTTFLPQQEIPVTETAGESDEDRKALRDLVTGGWLDMRGIAEKCETPESFADLRAGLFDPLLKDYEDWIADCEADARREGLDATYGGAAAANLARCRDTLARLRRGVETLENDEKARRAFAFANAAMADQRVHSVWALARRRAPEGAPKPALAPFDIPANRSWRAFQIAFILLALPALADPASPERTVDAAATADLLWFPTGGGKTEAYLGLAAFTMAVRRLQGPLGGLDASRGLAVVMRYTLRLLTIQQFQRASTLVCAMERLRAAAPDVWGGTPFTIGLWVGEKVTPNSTSESAEAIRAARNGEWVPRASPAQLTTCPWCGAPIDPGRDIEVDEDALRTHMFCSDPSCAFSSAQGPEGLPVVVVDEEIYRRPPSMMIATVDKFAQMAWKGATRSLFGRVDAECPRHGLLLPDDGNCKGNHQRKGALPATTAQSIAPLRPPDFVIQDEFHLIGGPLGTLVGLYETAIDRLCSWKLGDRTVRPKVVASTATIRKAADQMRGVFLRSCAVFPPSGIDVRDNFFAVQRPLGERSGRRYLGVCAPGVSRPATMIRVYVAFLTGAKALFDRFGELADPYMTAIGYFNSLRELGGMRRFCEDDVQDRAFRMNWRGRGRIGLAARKTPAIVELTSRISNKDIPRTLDRLEETFSPAGGGNPVDIALATNMLSVGVDVNRLGLMIVTGQPKNTAEYIQSTSRVGRKFPGLVCTVLSWARPRDFSHYESFEHFHATFYKHVEAQSVTPFARRALDRGLTGAMVSLVRLDAPNFAQNAGAERMQSSADAAAAAARDAFAARAWAESGEIDVRDLARGLAEERIDAWVKEAKVSGRHLVYDKKAAGGQGAASLLEKPDGSAWKKLSVPMSLREVEGTSQLVVNARPLPAAELALHPWQEPEPDTPARGDTAENP